MDKHSQKKLNELKKGEEVNHFLLVKKCELKTGKNLKSYLSLELGDSTITLPANIWDNIDTYSSSILPGTIVQLKGSIDEYQGQLQIRIKEIRKTTPDENFLFEDFLPKSKRNIDEMEKQLWDRINRIENPFLKSLLKNLLTGDNYKKFLKAPAGKSWHHSYIHGLLEHTLEITEICDLAANFHKEVNRDLLITGAILHDFGKIKELTFDTAFDYSDEGRLLGHIVIAVIEINNKINEVKNFPSSLKEQLLHLIISHQGKLEQASPVEPKTLEAIILYQADELSAKSNAYKSAIESEAKGDNRWTKFQYLINTHLFIPEEFNKKK
jgi:3'-5' exoribonuclease